MPFRRAQKKDANHAAICKHLRENHIWVEELDGAGRVTDTVLCNRDFETGFMEIKDDRQGTNFTRMQLSFIAACKPPVQICRTKETALAFAEKPFERGLSQKQKDALAGLLIRNTSKLIASSVVEKLIGEIK